MKSTESKVVIGSIGVDAGLCWIGDPCYIIGNSPELSWDSWLDFCDDIPIGEAPVMKSFNYKLGHEGAGVCVSTGYGDGTYEVVATIIEDPAWGKRIKKIEVTFIEDDE